MVIDRSNYEIWLIDWLDGNLSSDQIETVISFLKSNPDIKAEFDEVASLNLMPSEAKFRKKKLLKKATRELSQSQFEHLSISYLENDLQPAQLKELNEIIELDSEKAQRHALIQKTKLHPSDLKYKYKYQLIRRSVKQRVIRLSIIGLSTAAIIGLVIISYVVVPKYNINDTRRDGMRSVSIITPFVDTNGTHYIAATTKPIMRPDGSQSVSSTKPDMSGDGKFSVSTKTPAREGDAMHSVFTTKPDTTASQSQMGAEISPSVSLEKIIFNPDIDLNLKTFNNVLIASTFGPSVLSFDDGRSNVRRFLARNFRQRFLKEKDSKDTPLKPYEIAEAGVNGLNKLLGWQMAINTVNNENGEPASVYFTSKLVKFNTPVKKTQ